MCVSVCGSGLCTTCIFVFVCDFKENLKNAGATNRLMICCINNTRHLQYVVKMVQYLSSRTVAITFRVLQRAAMVYF